MPVYVFVCPVCNGRNELLLKLGDTEPRPCHTEGCDGTASLKLSRVAVSYQAWGFTKTDSLVGDTKGKDFKSLSQKAQELSDT